MIIFQGKVDLSVNIQRKKRMNRKVGIYALIACIIVLVLALIVNFVCFPNDPYEIIKDINGKDRMLFIYRNLK